MSPAGSFIEEASEAQRNCDLLKVTQVRKRKGRTCLTGFLVGWRRGKEEALPQSEGHPVMGRTEG
jgi:hypothetical protein